MSVWLDILLKVLPMLLKILEALLNDGGDVSASDRKKLAKLLDLVARLKVLAVKLCLVLAVALTFAGPSLSASPTASPTLTYAEGWAQAMATGRPLAVWVGQPAQALDGWICCEAKTFPGVEGRGVVVAHGLTADGDLIRLATFADVPPLTALRAAVRPVRLRSAAPICWPGGG